MDNSADNLPSTSTTDQEITGGNHPQFGCNFAQAALFINETLRVPGLFEWLSPKSSQQRSRQLRHTALPWT